MYNFTGILCLVKHGSSRSFFSGSCLKSIRAKKSTFRNSLFHVTPPNNDRLMKTQEVFSYSLWWNILRKGSTFRYPPSPTYTHTPTNTKNDRLMKIQEVFSYSLWLYLFIFIFIILQKESTFRNFIRFDSHKTMQMKTMNSVNLDTTKRWPRPINFTTHAVTYYEHIPVCINQRYTSLNKTLFLYNSIIAFIISRGNNIIPILTIIKDLSE